MKIAIIGYSGSGKSTLAKQLAHLYQIPKLHLDTLQFLPDWQTRTQESLTTDLGLFLDKENNWIIDGNYSFAYYERRMTEADQIIILTFSPLNSLWRVFKRYKKYKGHRREDMAEGCPEKLDWEFIRWVLYDGRKASARNRYKSIIQRYPEKTIILKNQKQINAYLKTLYKKETRILDCTLST